MDAFLSRKRLRVEEPIIQSEQKLDGLRIPSDQEDAESTDMKLAILASQYSHIIPEALLELLVEAGGSVEKVAAMIGVSQSLPPPRKRSAHGIGLQSSLTSFQQTGIISKAPSARLAPLTRKGATLHLYTPGDVAAHTPCSIIHNFLPTAEANALLRELLDEACTFGRQSFKVFDNVVQSPHSACFYVDNLEEIQKQKTEYLYNGAYLEDVRQLTPQMRSVSSKVQPAVNEEIARRIETHYPDSKKLRFQSPDPWVPNAAFVNRYKGKFVRHIINSVRNDCCN